MLAFAFLLLLVSFRSLVVAFKAIVLNLLSVGAAYGVLVATFQWGWGENLLDLSEMLATGIRRCGCPNRRRAVASCAPAGR